MLGSDDSEGEADQKNNDDNDDQKQHDVEIAKALQGNDEEIEGESLGE